MAAYDRIIILGGNGMLAHAFRHVLTQRGLKFVAPPRAELDITNSESVRAAFEQHRPTLVLNCAAHTKVDLCEQEEALASQINGHALANLSSLAKQHRS